MGAARAGCQKNGNGVFYAFEDEAGRTEWHFCDGSKVVAVPGDLPKVVPPVGRKAGKRSPKAQLEQARAFPAAEVQRAPKLPLRRLPPAKGAGAPEPDDEL
jgi:hypothetical protein